MFGVWERAENQGSVVSRTGKDGGGGDGQTAGTATRGRSQDAGAHPRQGGKSELLMEARPSDPDRPCSRGDRRKEKDGLSQGAGQSLCWAGGQAASSGWR